MPVHKIAVKRPNEPLELLDFEGTYRSDVTPLVGNKEHTYLQYVSLGVDGDRHLAMACDEDGMAKNLPVNFNMITHSGNHSFYESILGAVVFLVYREENTWEKEIWDFELESLNDKDIALIESLLSEKTQKYEKLMSELDPGITKTPTMFFEPIEDLDDFLGISPSPYVPIPSFIIPTYLFRNWSRSKPFIFYSDRKGTIAYKTGLQASPISREFEIYCKSDTIAQSFTKKIPILPNGVSQEKAMNLIAEYLKKLNDWGLPPVLYVSAETEEMLKFD